MTDRTVRVRLEAITSMYSAKLAQAAAATKTFGKTTDDMSARTRKGMDMIGVGMVGVGAAIVGGLGLAAKAAMDFESSFAGVRKTVDATEGQFAQMASELRDLAPALGVNVNELNAIAEEAGQLGIARPNIVGFTETVAKLRETTDLVDAAPLARFMNIMQTAEGEVGNLGAALVALGNAGASTESEIIDMAQGIAGAANIVGVTEAGVLGFANALSSIGIRAEAGGSSLSRVMLDIGEAVDTGGGKLEKFAEVAGISSEEFQTAFERDPAAAIATFIEGLGRINESGGNVAGTLRELSFSEIRVRRMLLGLAGAGDLLTESLDLGNKSIKEGTALNEEFEKRMDTTAKKIDQAQAELAEFAITIGSVLLPAIGKVAEIGGNVFGDFADAINALPGPLKAVAVGLTSVVGIVALAAGGFLLLAPRIATTKLALDTLGISAKVASLNLSKLGFSKIFWPVAAAYATASALKAVGVEEIELTRAQEAATRSFELGIITQEKYNEVVGQTGEHYKRAIGPSKSFVASVREAPELFDSVSESVIDFGGAVNKSGHAVRQFAGMTRKEFKEWRVETIGAINSVDDVLAKLAGRADLTAGQIIKAFIRQTRRMADYEDNWDKLLQRDLPDSLTKQLQEMGIEGAGIVQQLANANDKQFERIIREWLRAEGISNRTANAIADDLGKVGGKAKGAADEVAGLGTQLHNLPSSVGVDVKVTGTQIGDGPGRVGGGGLAVAWANSAIGAVPGPQYITSTYRSPAHNAAVGGSPTSYHLDASNPAADIGGSNLGAIYNYLTRFPVRELINEGDHIHVADQGGTFKGPGLVRMGAGFETFASGLQPAQKVRDIVSPVPVMRQVVRQESISPAVLEEAVTRALHRWGPAIDNRGSINVDMDDFAQEVVKHVDRRRTLMTGRRG